MQPIRVRINGGPEQSLMVGKVPGVTGESVVVRQRVFNDEGIEKYQEAKYLVSAIIRRQSPQDDLFTLSTWA